MSVACRQEPGQLLRPIGKIHTVESKEDSRLVSVLDRHTQNLNLSTRNAPVFTMVRLVLQTYDFGRSKPVVIALVIPTTGNAGSPCVVADDPIRWIIIGKLVEAMPVSGIDLQFKQVGM
jgi:hypothetical protein